MLSLHPAATRYGLRIALPALIILIGTVATVVVSLNRMAGEVNSIEDALKERSTSAAIRTVLKRIGQSNRDYAEWDDAVRRLYGTVDQDFVRENFEPTTENEVFFDTAYVLDEDRVPVVAMRLGAAVDVPLEQAFSPAIHTLIDRLPTDARSYAAATGLVDGAWGITAVAVGPIVPTSEEFAPWPAHARYLIFAKAFDRAALDLIAEEYLLEGLRFVDPHTKLENQVDLRDPDGNLIAALTWPAGNLGSAAHAEINPAVLIMLALIGVTMAVLITIAVRGLNEVKLREAHARHAALHDSLSGLPNRAALIRGLEERVAACRADGSGGAVIYLDLDGFKSVNDTYGHDVGDHLLRKVAAGFHAICGERLFGRVGGDEFAIVVDGHAPMEEARDIGRLLIRYLSQPFDIGGRIIPVGTSVGIAELDKNVPSAEEALRRADVAMYQAKQQGRNRIFVYHAAIDTLRHKRLEIAADLRAALRSDSLEIVYQPVFDATTRRIVGAEALLRWLRPGHGPVPPAVFVPIAEETGLIDELGAWTLRRACREAVTWSDIRLSVNVSPAQFRNPNFESLVGSILMETELAAGRLELEITENYLVSNPDQARRSIDAIRKLGVAVSLDDFGTGYSSIGYLRSFTFDKLKLDRSLIAGIATDAQVQRLAQATIAIADALDLQVTAEGVESEEEAVLLRLAGCHEFQGFFFAKPVLPAEFARLLAADKPARPQIVAVASG